jgi:uncharacterized protein (TIGR00251 family)
MPTLHVKVVPGSSRDRVAGQYGEGIKVQVSAPPEDGKANQAVIAVLAEALGVKPVQVTLVRGQTQPRKVFEVSGIDQGDLDARLAAILRA